MTSNEPASVLAPTEEINKSNDFTGFKLFWFSISSLHDTSNGAAIHNKVLLESLAARGMKVIVLNALVADDPRGLANFIAKIQPHLSEGRKTLRLVDNGVNYVVVNTSARVGSELVTSDHTPIMEAYLGILEEFQPDTVMGYGGDIFSAYLRRETQARGIPVVYALCNGLHLSFAFNDCDLVFAPSKATAKIYYENDGTDVKAVGQFIDNAKVLVPEAMQAQNQRSYITLINPAPEKGLAIFIKLVEAYAKKYPEQRFLVVKSVGDYRTNLAQLVNADGSPYFVPEQDPQPYPLDRIDVAEHTDDIRLVYAVSKVVLCPSVWHESWGCVATEAVMNHIPVLATNSGGLSEAVDTGGIVLAAPESTLNNYRCVPSDDEIAPFVAALERLMQEDWTERCEEAKAKNDLEVSVNRLWEYLKPVMQKGQQTKCPLDHSYFFSDKSMARRKERILAAKG